MLKLKSTRRHPWLNAIRMLGVRKGRLHIRGSSHKPPVAFADYCRIFSVIAAIVEEESVPHHACNLFASIGAHILRQHYRLPAFAVSGAAFFKVSSDFDVLAFAEHSNGRVFASLEGFHSWIQCKGYMIDLLASLFPENVAERDMRVDVPRRAFMKPLTQALSRLPEQNDPEGAYTLLPDHACQVNLEQTMNRPLVSDLHTITATWFRRPPKSMDSELAIRDNRGKIIIKKRKDIGVRGFW